jgi:hypothetical protein
MYTTNVDLEQANNRKNEVGSLRIKTENVMSEGSTAIHIEGKISYLFIMVLSTLGQKKCFFKTGDLLKEA